MRSISIRLIAIFFLCTIALTGCISDDVTNNGFSSDTLSANVESNITFSIPVPSESTSSRDEKQEISVEGMNLPAWYTFEFIETAIKSLKKATDDEPDRTKELYIGFADITGDDIPEVFCGMSGVMATHGNIQYGIFSANGDILLEKMVLNCGPYNFQNISLIHHTVHFRFLMAAIIKMEADRSIFCHELRAEM